MLLSFAVNVEVLLYCFFLLFLVLESTVCGSENCEKSLCVNSLELRFVINGSHWATSCANSVIFLSELVRFYPKEMTRRTVVQDTVYDCIGWWFWKLFMQSVNICSWLKWNWNNNVERAEILKDSRFINLWTCETMWDRIEKQKSKKKYTQQTNSEQNSSETYTHFHTP